MTVAKGNNNQGITPRELLKIIEADESTETGKEYLDFETAYIRETSQRYYMNPEQELVEMGFNSISFPGPELMFG